MPRNATEFYSVDRYLRYNAVIELSTNCGQPFISSTMEDSKATANPTHRLECIKCAYQLRFHFGWYSYKRHPLFAGTAVKDSTRSLLQEIAQRNEYHILEMEIEPHVIRSLISLKPTDCPSEVTRIVKGNLHSKLTSLVSGKIWSRGWYVRSNGNVCSETVNNYVSNQFQRHRASPIRNSDSFAFPFFEDDSAPVQIQSIRHAVYQNNLHFVFCVSKRADLLDSEVSHRLKSFWLQLFERENWNCSRLSILADHVHCSLCLRPDVVPMSVAFRMLNNAEFWFAKRWSHALRSAKVDALFQSSFYVGTHGDATTAQIASYLKNLNPD